MNNIQLKGKKKFFKILIWEPMKKYEFPGHGIILVDKNISYLSM